MTDADRVWYSTWPLISPSGKERIIENPRGVLKRVQARLAALLSEIEAPQYLYCPVKKRSYVSNAAAHMGAQAVITMDIACYFPSTTWKRVYWFFNKRLLMSTDCAWMLATIACVNDRLPTGSPLSPIMSFYAHEDMWEKINRMVTDCGCKCTVYMDDLTISGPLVPSRLVWQVKRAIVATGLTLNDKKQRRFEGVESIVTGVVVSRDGLRVRKGAHLKLKKLREAYALSSADDRPALSRKIMATRSQHRQVVRGAPKL